MCVSLIVPIVSHVRGCKASFYHLNVLHLLTTVSTSQHFCTTCCFTVISNTYYTLSLYPWYCEFLCCPFTKIQWSTLIMNFMIYIPTISPINLHVVSTLNPRNIISIPHDGTAPGPPRPHDPHDTQHSNLDSSRLYLIISYVRNGPAPLFTTSL